jgi:hypothetical protein
MNVIIIGIIARFSMVDMRLFHSLDADKISYAARRPIRQTVVMMLISETPDVENKLVAEVVLKTLRVLVALIVLIIDDNIVYLSCLNISSSSKYK